VIGEVLEGTSHGLIQVLSHYMPAGTDEDLKYFARMDNVLAEI
jgi:hypothetical protein